MSRERGGTERRQAGWSILEVLLAVAIVTVALMVTLQQLSIGYREAEHNGQRTFAFQRAAALLSELQNATDLGIVKDANELYALVDTAPNPTLTTRRDSDGLPLAPEHAMSGNYERQGHWAWARRLSLKPHEQAGLYYATVHVLHWNGAGWGTLASQTQLLSLLPDADAPTQTFDLYLLACGESPSLLDELPALREQVRRVVADRELTSQARFRLHWITRLGYGRDPCYAPFVNTAAPNTSPAPWAYWLPARADAAGGATLYDTDLLAGVHRTSTGFAGSYSELSFAVADRNNHCLRAPAALALYEQRLAAGLEDPEAPPLQVLLEQMHSDPARYRGAIFVNLHGSGLPLPPLRNYSDPAKDPAGHPGVRVVTHPARLWTPCDPNGDGIHADSKPLELRVHAWLADPASGPSVLSEPILITIPGPVDLGAVVNGGPDTTLEIRRLPGGVDPNTGSSKVGARNYSGFDSPAGLPPTTPGKPYEMWYETGFVGGAKPYTWIRLHNTPLVAPRVGLRGLDASARLYGLDYVPSPVLDNDTFATDLARDDPDERQPRNTARWRIRLQRTLLAPSMLGNQGQTLQITTRIGTDQATGRRWPEQNQPNNVSDTWAWWTRTPAAVPPTERAQFLGDPRHCPYADLTQSGATTPNGYNWHFDNLVRFGQDATGYWPCFDEDRLASGFGSRCRADAPRLLQLLRTTLQECGGVFVSPGGTARQLLLGGDVTAPGAAGATTAVPLHADYLAVGSGPALVDTCQSELLLGSSSDPGWWSKPWLGELYPDAQWSSWHSAGNLPLGAAGNTFHWRTLTALPGLPYGTSFAYPTTNSSLGDPGAVMLFDAGNGATAFRHVPATATATTALTALQSIATSLNTRLPTATAAAAFGLAESLPANTEAYRRVDSYPRNTATLREPLLRTTGGQEVTGIVDIAATPERRAFFVPLALTHGLGEAEPLLLTALLGGLRALHVAGLPALPGRVAEVPQLTVLEPKAGFTAYDPAGVTLRWQVAFRRYDGQPYTAAHPADFAEAERNLVYRVLWTPDAGNHWYSVLTGEPARPGDFPADPADRLADIGEGAESFTVATTPEAFPTGEYRFRVEAHDLTRGCHFGSHQVRVVIRRSG